MTNVKFIKCKDDDLKVLALRLIELENEQKIIEYQKIQVRKDIFKKIGDADRVHGVGFVINSRQIEAQDVKFFRPSFRECRVQLKDGGL